MSPQISSPGDLRATMLLCDHDVPDHPCAARRAIRHRAGLVRAVARRYRRITGEAMTEREGMRE